MGEKAAPLCSTCAYHEHQTSRVSIMWGAAWIFGAVIGPITVGIIVTLIFTNRADISVLHKEQVDHVRAVNGSLHEIETTLGSVSINQKRLMETVGVKYIHPERIHKGED